MPKSKRGPERRRTKRDATSLSPELDADDERRGDPDRRRNSYISRLELCRGLPYGEVEDILERCPIKSLSKNEVLLEPGQANHHLYFLLSGRLDVRLKSDNSPIADVINVGECSGEMSIIDGKPTSAYVTAGVTSTVLEVHENIFWSKIATHPAVVRNLSRVLAERMRRRNDATLRALEQEIRLQQLQKELIAAYEIQVGMLPQGPPLVPEQPTLDVYARMDVVKSVGGDFYDAFSIDEHRVCVAIGDVSGKGMPAALFMVRTLTLLRAELIRPGELTDCMNRFNEALCDTNISHMFASLVVLRIDVRDGSVEYVNAGHTPMLLSRQRGAFTPEDDSRGLIAGVLEDNVYECGRVQLQAGDRILLYTDGVTEARNVERHFYGMQHLQDILSQLDPVDSTHLVETIVNDTHAFAAGTAQSDDVTVVAIGFRAPL